jgi:hypothetical protein
MRPLRPEHGSLNHITRGCQGRSSKTIRKSIQQITRIMEIVSHSPQSRRKRDISITLPMQRSGARSIAPQYTI